jgi:hypothetical protein
MGAFMAVRAESDGRPPGCSRSIRFAVFLSEFVEIVDRIKAQRSDFALTAKAAVSL